MLQQPPQRRLLQLDPRFLVACSQLFHFKVLLQINLLLACNQATPSQLPSLSMIPLRESQLLHKLPQPQLLLQWPNSRRLDRHKQMEMQLTT
jgi:hypothetical protein